jgi:hypothetical protein
MDPNGRQNTAQHQGHDPTGHAADVAEAWQHVIALPFTIRVMPLP